MVLLEKLSRIFTWSILLALVGTIILWLLPSGNGQSAEVYALTFVDHIVYGMIYVFPVALSIVICTYIAFQLLTKYSKFSIRTRWFVSALIAVTFVGGVVWQLLQNSQRTDRLNFIPDMYDIDIHAWTDYQTHNLIQMNRKNENVKRFYS